MKAVDLHVHSNKSDGSCTPSELVSMAVEKNIRAFALTDHDTIDGLEEAMQAALAYNCTAAVDQYLEVIPGIELSTEYLGRDVHIVGLDINYRDPVFLSRLQSFQDSRILRNVKMCDNLRTAGIDISFEQLHDAFPDSVITRAHYARYLLAHGYVKSLPEAFDRYLGDHTKYFVPREKVTPVQAVELILCAGGIPVLAHPVLYHMSAPVLETLVFSLKEAGLIGMECVYSTYSSSEERNMKRLADNYGLCYSGGSDFHGLAKPGLELGTGYGHLFVPADLLDRLRIAAYSRRKILFTDLDGTLLTDEKTISQITKKALDDLHHHGHILVLSSGRPLRSILEVREHLHLTDTAAYIIAYNGSLLYDCTRKMPLLEKTISMEDVRIIMEQCHALGIHCHTYENDHIICEHETKELLYYRKHIHLPCLAVHSIPAVLKREPYKMIAIHLTSHALLEKLQRAIQKKTANRITAVFSNDFYLEFFPADSGKGAAVSSLCDLLHIPISDSAAIGDAANDISMLHAAGLGCAIQNAPDEVKKEADYITAHDNNHDGICDLLAYFF